MRYSRKGRVWWLVVVGILCALQSAHADVVTEWNATAVESSARVGSRSQSRLLAITHAAIFDAVNAIGGRHKRYAAEVKAPAGASQEAAAATAAHTVLSWLLPAQKRNLDGALTQSLAKVPEGTAKNDGMMVGKQVAEQYIATRSNDGSTGKLVYTPRSGAGQWQPTPPTQAPMVAPHWAKVTPFVLTVVTELNVKGPPALESAQFAADMDEVRRLGGRNSTERTADQTTAAIFWEINTPVPWNVAARAATAAKGTSIIENARIFALMNMAGADALIASWAIKQQYGFWRPVTAIRAAAANPDPHWKPLLKTPAHPEYVSAHCAYAGAAARVLRRLFGDDGVKISVTSRRLNEITRSYSGFTQMEKEVEDARIWGGIHFRTSDEHGTALGHQIADLAVQRHMLPVAQ